MIKFFGARILTLMVEQLGMYLFIDYLGYYRLLVKACVAVVVIILNYIFSKIFVFQKRE